MRMKIEVSEKVPADFGDQQAHDLLHHNVTAQQEGNPHCSTLTQWHPVLP